MSFSHLPFAYFEWVKETFPEDDTMLGDFVRDTTADGLDGKRLGELGEWTPHEIARALYNVWRQYVATADAFPPFPCACCARVDGCPRQEEAVDWDPGSGRGGQAKVEMSGSWPK